MVQNIIGSLIAAAIWVACAFIIRSIKKKFEGEKIRRQGLSDEIKILIVGVDNSTKRQDTILCIQTAISSQRQLLYENYFVLVFMALIAAVLCLNLSLGTHSTLTLVSTLSSIPLIIYVISLIRNILKDIEILENGLVSGLISRLGSNEKEFKPFSETAQDIRARILNTEWKWGDMGSISFKDYGHGTSKFFNIDNWKTFSDNTWKALEDGRVEWRDGKRRTHILQFDEEVKLFISTRDDGSVIAGSIKKKNGADGQD